MKRSFWVFLMIGLLSSGGGREPRVDRPVEGGTEVDLNHLEPVKLRGVPSRLLLEEDPKIDFERAEYGEQSLKEPSFAEAGAAGNILVLELQGIST